MKCLNQKLFVLTKGAGDLFYINRYALGSGQWIWLQLYPRTHLSWGLEVISYGCCLKSRLQYREFIDILPAPDFHWLGFYIWYFGCCCEGYIRTVVRVIFAVPYSLGGISKDGYKTSHIIGCITFIKFTRNGLS